MTTWLSGFLNRLQKSVLSYRAHVATINFSMPGIHRSHDFAVDNQQRQSDATLLKIKFLRENRRQWRRRRLGDDDQSESHKTLLMWTCLLLAFHFPLTVLSSLHGHGPSRTHSFPLFFFDRRSIAWLIFCRCSMSRASVSHASAIFSGLWTQQFIIIKHSSCPIVSSKITEYVRFPIKLLSLNRQKSFRGILIWSDEHY